MADTHHHNNPLLMDDSDDDSILAPNPYFSQPSTQASTASPAASEATTAVPPPSQDELSPSNSLRSEADGLIDNEEQGKSVFAVVIVCVEQHKRTYINQLVLLT